ncbi:Adenine phosphoribosyltransferase [Armadillidium vulgare]|nr:Adenine phosphoribosyltransferase [Armadillidium vulgare]
MKEAFFRDIFSVLRDPPSFAILIDLLKIKVQELGTSIDAIVGLDSRGFIFGSVLAYDLQKPFVPIRKKGKLPGEIEKVNFKLEYGEETFYPNFGHFNEASHDWYIHSTMKAACELITSLGATVSLCLVCIELVDLNGRYSL